MVGGWNEREAPMGGRDAPWARMVSEPRDGITLVFMDGPRVYRATTGIPSHVLVVRHRERLVAEPTVRYASLVNLDDWLDRARPGLVVAVHPMPYQTRGKPPKVVRTRVDHCLNGGPTDCVQQAIAAARWAGVDVPPGVRFPVELLEAIRGPTTWTNGRYRRRLTLPDRARRAEDHPAPPAIPALGEPQAG